MKVLNNIMAKKKGLSTLNTKRKKSFKTFRQNLDLYLLLVPGLILLFIFKYVPMYGIIIAFKDFDLNAGILGSKWVGLYNFRRLIESASFGVVFQNTLIISFFKIVILFPIPIIIALLMSEMKNMYFKKFVQTIITLPHFLSWVVLTGLFVNILGYSGGFVNEVLNMFGVHSISFLTNPKIFRGLIVFTAGWKEVGWSAIIYIAAIAGVDKEQYEAAYIDGAGRFKQMIYVTLPGIASTIVVLLVLRLGGVLEAGTEQILLLYSPTVYSVGDVIGTYVYRMGLGEMQYSYATAVGIFNSVIGFLLVIFGNFASKKITGKSIW